MDFSNKNMKFQNTMAIVQKATYVGMSFTAADISLIKLLNVLPEGIYYRYETRPVSKQRC